MKNIYLKVLEFGKNKPKGFSFNELTSYFGNKLEEWEVSVLHHHAQTAFVNKTNIRPQKDSMFTCVVHGKDIYNSKFALSLESYFKYIDYLELKQAKKISHDANENSKRAQELAIQAIIVAIMVPLLIEWEEIIRLFQYLVFTLTGEDVTYR